MAVFGGLLADSCIPPNPTPCAEKGERTRRESGKYPNVPLMAVGLSRSSRTPLLVE